MRIVCPNCGAQYEVDAALIPAPGRDVQCSNCGRGWFQAHAVTAEPEVEPAEAPQVPEADPAPTPEPEPAAEADAVFGAEADGTEPELVDERTLEPSGRPAEPEPEPETMESEIARMVEAEREAEPEPAIGPAPADAPDTEAVAEQEQASPVEHPETGVTDESIDIGARTDAATDESARPLVDLSAAPANAAAARHDPETLAVLREEAERELTERRRESGGLETQPDLGLETAPPERPSSQAEPAAGEVAARKDLLPDIDEINSSLSPETAVAIANSLSGHEDTQVADRRRGFRLGFGTMVLAAALLIALYLAAPWLVRTVPGAETFLVSYVDWANGVRDWIDGVLAAGVDRIS